MSAIRKRSTFARRAAAGFVLIALASSTIAACSGGNSAAGARFAAVVPSAASISGEGSLMSNTVAGKNACNPANHNRPFIVEWDGTDIASFEARAETDVVFVHYEGCELRIVEACHNSAIKGSFGSYKSVEWTAGTTDRVDVKSEEELVAKLPLGVASFGGRVKKGEKLHLEYFVSGVRSATRDGIYRDDLVQIPACREATHFVAGYNLGAFSLAAGATLDSAAAAQLVNQGTAGRKQFESSAEKNGGLISSCRGESAKETQTCKVPIRLTLRALQEGANPEAAVASAPETPTALNLASTLKASSEREHKATEQLRTAGQRLVARDGRACLAALDSHDSLDPRPAGISSSPQGYPALMRAQCLMLAGQCAAGKQLAKRNLEATGGAARPPSVTDNLVDYYVGEHCQGGNLTPRDELLIASRTLVNGTQRALAPAACSAAYAKLNALRTPLAEAAKTDEAILRAYSNVENEAAGCFAKAGNCDAAWGAWRDENVRKAKAQGARENYTRYATEFIGPNRFAGCKAALAARTAPREQYALGMTILDLADNHPANQPTLATACSEGYAKGKAALAGLPAMQGDDDYEMRTPDLRLHTDATKCFAEANDCAGAWAAHRAMTTARNAQRTAPQSASGLDEASTRSEFASSHRACAAVVPDSLPPLEKFYAAYSSISRYLNEKSENTCARDFATLRATRTEAEKTEAGKRTVAQIDRAAARCAVHFKDCANGLAMYTEAAGWEPVAPGRTRPDPAAQFYSSTRECTR